ncbi:helix-turn-helix domain-containing protein [Deefgea tanakiae]|uniref:Helix-turn-helix domain-containing protein n=1 Tax=Deefgea tanakiae TaxID=2865840 RepID=A0ABX8Z648_9NEIS|nr:helix-turn-helix transcriptional regulator [Deefgea tanakiae]QZA76384.1 helix-turn-helix domain-containing protein [Deefgea tanakiae]
MKQDGATDGMFLPHGDGFGERLRAERLGIRLSQQEFADLGGVSRPAQANYEAEKREPSLSYLSAISQRVDVLYVINGQRASKQKCEVDEKLIEMILETIDDWAQQENREIPRVNLSQFLSLFINQALNFGGLEPKGMAQVLRLVK